MFYIILSIFVILPVIEIATFIQFGSVLGTFNTILLIFVTAIIGIYLVRLQGLSTILNINNDIQSGKAPIEHIIGGLIIAISGLLLLVPGFVTDLLGFIGLIPHIRKLISQFIIKKYINPMYTSKRQQDNSVIDVDYVEIKDEDEK